jgi:hypothetical protein
MCSSKVCTAQVANGSDYKIGIFDAMSNTRLEFHTICLHVKLTGMATPDTLEGRLIITDIIPAIVKLRSQYDIKFTTMFSYHVLLERGNPLHITSADITSSDKFFDSISFK